MKSSAENQGTKIFEDYIGYVCFFFTVPKSYIEKISNCFFWGFTFVQILILVE